MTIFLYLALMNALAQTGNETSATVSPASGKDTMPYEKEFRKYHSLAGMLSYGLKAGINQNNIYGSEIDYIFATPNTQSLLSIHAGLLINTQWNKYFWLKHELLFSTRGALVTLNDSIHGEYSSKFKTLYLDLFPVSPSLHFKGLQFYGGPYLSILANACIQRKNENGDYFNDRSIFGTPENREGEDENKYLQKFDYGLHAGVEYQFSFGLLIGVKYLHGLADIFQYANSFTNDDTKTNPIKIYNKSIMFSVGYTRTRKR
ncbi:MAG: PorT family protein [Cytophagaceae bacterium]|nr:PorT family protein [Cytophagaceae bacterium]MDW8457033.1 porin family protein [Cytophagaceae bacterium]